MVANPTNAWDKVPVTGKYLNIADESPKSGTIVFTLLERISRVDGTVIYPKGGKVTVPLSGAGVINTMFPASDDPDITPNGWSVKVDERLSDGSGETYYIEPTLATGEIKLGQIPFPTTQQPAPAEMKGVPGGLAALDAEGRVLDGAGNPVTGGASTWTEVSNKPATFPPSAHTHVQGDVTGLTAALGSKLDSTGSVETLADGATKKLMTSTERAKLTGVAPGATINSTDVALRDRSTHTGTQTSATISDFAEAIQDTVAAMLVQGSGVTLSYNDAGNTLTVTSTGSGGITDPEVVRDTIGTALIGVGVISVQVNDAADTITISSSATMNSTDAALRDRGTHTGVQAISTVNGLQAALDAKLSALTYANALAGSNFKVPFGTATRPSPRTDIFFTIVGGTAADADPAWMLNYDDRLLTS